MLRELRRSPFRSDCEDEFGVVVTGSLFKFWGICGSEGGNCRRLGSETDSCNVIVKFIFDVWDSANYKKSWNTTSVQITLHVLPFLPSQNNVGWHWCSGVFGFQMFCFLHRERMNIWRRFFKNYYCGYTVKTVFMLYLLAPLQLLSDNFGT